MRIPGSGIGSVNTPVGNTGRPSPQGGADSKGKDAVVLSPAASQIAQSAAEATAARAARVAQLKHQVRGGTYKVDREALANRLVDDELARSGRR